MAAFIILGVAAMLIAYTIISDRGKDSPADSSMLEIQHFGDNYESRKQNVSAITQSVNEKYREELRAKLQKEADEAIKSGKIKDPDIINQVVEIIDIHEKDNTVWDVRSYDSDTTQSACNVTYGLLIRTKRPVTTDDMRIIDNNEVHIVLNRGYYSSSLPYAEVCNNLIYNNARRYLYKFLEGRISEKQLDGIFDELLASDNDAEIIENHGGVDYNFEYDAFTKEIHVTILWG